MSIHIHVGRGNKYYDARDCADGDDECHEMYEEKERREDCHDLTKDCEHQKEELMHQNEQLKDNDSILSRELADKTREIANLKKEKISATTQIKILTQKAAGFEEKLRRISPTSVSGDISRRF